MTSSLSLPPIQRTLDQGNVCLYPTEADQVFTFNILGNSKIASDRIFLDVTGSFSALNAFLFRGGCLRQTVDYFCIINNSEKVDKLWFDLTNLVIENEELGEAVIKIRRLLTENKIYFFGDEETAKLQLQLFEKDIQSKNSWLSYSRNYLYIRDVLIDKDFIYEKIDIFNLKDIRDFSKQVFQKGYLLDTLYLSNSYEMAKKRNLLTIFQSSMSFLQLTVDDNTYIIDDYIDKDEYIQRIRNKFRKTKVSVFFPCKKLISYEDNQDVKETLNMIVVQDCSHEKPQAASALSNPTVLPAIPQKSNNANQNAAAQKKKVSDAGQDTGSPSVKKVLPVILPPIKTAYKVTREN